MTQQEWIALLPKDCILDVLSVGGELGYEVETQSGRSKADMVEQMAALFDDSGVDDEDLIRMLQSLDRPRLIDVMGALDIIGDATRKAELIDRLVEYVHDCRRLGAAIIDQGRRDVCPVDGSPEDEQRRLGFSLVPSTPLDPAAGLVHELRELFGSSDLERGFVVTYACNEGELCTLLESQSSLDVLMDGAIARRGRTSRIDVILNRESLTDETPARRLGALLSAFPEQYQLWLPTDGRRLHAKTYGAISSTGEARHLVAFVGSANLTKAGMGRGHEEGRTFPASPPAFPPNIELNVRISGEVHDRSFEESLLRWVDELLTLCRRASESDLHALGVDHTTLERCRYKAALETIEAVRRKRIAEQLVQRGRHVFPLFAPDAIEPPLPHQLSPVACSAAPWSPGYMLFDEVGLGKTVEAGFILSRELRRARRTDPERPAQRALIVAPAALHQQWRGELKSKFALDVTIVGRSAAGLTRDWDQTVEVFITSPKIVLIDNEKGDLPPFDIVIVDECHRAQGQKTFDALAEITSEARFSLFSSGTPIQNQLDDIWHSATLAADGFFPDNISAMEALFETPDGGADRLRAQLQPFASRQLRRNLPPGTIPPRVPTDKICVLSVAATQVYRELQQLRRDYMTVERRNTAFAFTLLEQAFLSSIQAFQHATRGVLEAALDDDDSEDDELGRETHRDHSYAFLRGGKHRGRQHLARWQAALQGESSSAKEAQLIDILRHCDDSRVLVFVRFIATQTRLLQVLKDECPSWSLIVMNGSTPPGEREYSFERFNDRRLSRGQPLVMICTDVAAEGLNLQRACHTLVNYDLPWNPQRIEQRIGRLQRWGQQRAVQIFSLASRGADDAPTKDGDVLRACWRKFRMAEGAVGISDALLDWDPETFASAVTESFVEELRLEADTDREATVNRLAGCDLSHPRLIALQQTYDDSRRWFARFSADDSVAHHRSNAVLRAVREATLRGHIAIVRRSAAQKPTPSDRIVFTGFRLYCGVRGIVEALADRNQRSKKDAPLEACWLIDDERPMLLVASEQGRVAVADRDVLEQNLVEVPRDEASRAISRAALDYLIQIQAALRADGVDGRAADWWLSGDASELHPLIAACVRFAEGEVARRRDECELEWATHKTFLERHLEEARVWAEECARSTPVRKNIRELEERFAARRVQFRTDVWVTQLVVELLHN
jgi:superfamily II DNA or RNA helicase